MKHGILVSNVGSFADPRTTVRVARAAERAGWEAFLVWDHLAFAWGFDVPSADPWMTLAAVASATDSILLGTGVTPLARRRPHVVAHQLATLDALAPGRIVFGAGLGGERREFAAFGEDADERVRARKLDEGLEVVRRLLSGEPVEHRGEHFVVDGVTLAPAPARPVPFWIGGMSARARKRAERYDAWFADTADAGRMTTTPAQLRALLVGHRLRDVAVLGYSRAGEGDLREAYSRAGATWWIEQLHDRRDDADALLARVAAGP